MGQTGPTRTALRCVLFVILFLLLLFLILLSRRPPGSPGPFSCMNKATPDRFDLHIRTSKQEYGFNETIHVYCRIHNRTGDYMVFDGQLIESASQDAGYITLRWLDSETGTLTLTSSDGISKELSEHRYYVPVGRKKRETDLPPQGASAHLKYSAESLGIDPGAYTLTLGVLGKSAQAKFRIKGE